MKNFEIIILVFALLIALLAIADRLKLSTPILLVLMGLALGFIPAMPSFILNPDVVFLLFLPPVLYDAASHTSWHDFKAEIKPITTLAIALVFFTTLSVALASYYLIPGFTWPMAFILGAIVSPPDAVAATSITKGLGLNKRVITILEGESLVNDASALIAYRIAIGALATGTFALLDAGLTFTILVAGGILCGVIIGYLFILVHKLILNNSIISTSLTIPGAIHFLFICGNPSHIRCSCCCDYQPDDHMAGTKTIFLSNKNTQPCRLGYSDLPVEWLHFHFNRIAASPGSPGSWCLQ